MKTKKATVKATGEKIEVYKSSMRNTWINAKDCTTEYTQEQLIFD